MNPAFFDEMQMGPKTPVPRTLRSRVERVMRDVERQVVQVPDPGRAALMELIDHMKRILRKS